MFTTVRALVAVVARAFLVAVVVGLRQREPFGLQL